VVLDDVAPSPSAVPRPAVAGRLGFFVVAVLGCLADLISKSAIFSRLGDGGSGMNVMPVIPGVISFQTALNTGGAWSLLQGYPIFFLVVRSIAIVVVFYFFSKADSRRIAFLWGLGFVLAGATGNLWDQIFHPGVRDFIRLDFIHFPIFNLADTWINVGAGLILLQWLLDSRRRR
jgi:signal peptidase II